MSTRSVRDHFAGVVMLARTTDKARAQHAGTLGEYQYNCPMDRAVFTFLGIDHECFYVRQYDSISRK